MPLEHSTKSKAAGRELRRFCVAALEFHTRPPGQRAPASPASPLPACIHMCGQASSRMAHDWVCGALGPGRGYSIIGVRLVYHWSRW